MLRDKPVSLCKSAGYWKAYYYDPRTNKRRSKSFGPIGKISERQARVLSDRLIADLALNAAGTTASRLPTLIEYRDHLIKTHASDLAEVSLKEYDRTFRYLIEFFGPTIRLDRILPLEASRFRKALREGELKGAHLGRGMSVERLSDASVAHYMRYCRAIFNTANHEYSQIGGNPFGHLSRRPKPPKKRWHHVTIDSDFPYDTGQK